MKLILSSLFKIMYEYTSSQPIPLLQIAHELICQEFKEKKKSSVLLGLVSSSIGVNGNFAIDLSGSRIRPLTLCIYSI